MKERLNIMSIQRKKGFTLIELLVVISIIAILMSILIPAMRKAKAQAQSVICMTRQSQIITGMTAYTVDNNNEMPPNREITGRDLRYFNLVAPYCGAKDKADLSSSNRRGSASDSYLFRCTTQDYITKRLLQLAPGENYISPVTGEEYVGFGGVTTGNGIYAYNANFTGSANAGPWKTSQFKLSAELPVLTCNNVEDVELYSMGVTDINGRRWSGVPTMRWNGINPIALLQGWPWENKRKPPKVSWDGPAPVHSKGHITYSFADGSVRKMGNFWPFDKDDVDKNVKRYFHPQRID
jgi:prepilin-type N-terminal cleavage/methylation domain-containing protein